MNIEEAKQHVANTVKVYLATDEGGTPLIEPSEQRPLFLVGAPGIGKTAIVGQVARELGIGEVTYSMTHHTRQSALGLPFIVHREFEGRAFDASEYTMSEIIASIYDYMRDTGKRQGILFLDEINCVSETLYPSMLQFLQFKTFGRHRIPDGWVVVCAGNPPAYNRSVHEFDIVTLDRLRKIDIEPDFATWRRYAAGIGVHPAVLTFLDAKKEAFYAVESTPAGKSFVTARGWVDLSRVMVLHEKNALPVDGSLIGQFIQKDDIAEQFASYYQLFAKYRSDYQVDRILTGNAEEGIIERAQAAPFDERLAVISLMLDTLGTRMGEIIERNAELEDVRDRLRTLKEPLLAGEDVRSTLGAHIEEASEELTREHAAGHLVLEQLRRRTCALDVLKHLRDACASANTLQGEHAFATIQRSFRKLVSALEEDIASASAQLECAFDFIDRAFADERASLVFVTELTARHATAQFINKFGSDRYYESNERLLLAKHADSLTERVSALRSRRQGAAE